ncbi:hypothetical protein BD779DRAFT_1675610 [Infundibulicybe gibba]|nr:hypothetical protein BD779DRAFT_1675610 [Infundibulicybe gibba]
MPLVQLGTRRTVASRLPVVPQNIGASTPDESQPATGRLAYSGTGTNQSTRNVSRAQKRTERRPETPTARPKPPTTQVAGCSRPTKKIGMRQKRREAEKAEKVFRKAQGKPASPELLPQNATKMLLKNIATQVNEANRLGQAIPLLSSSTHMAKWSDEKSEGIDKQFRKAFNESNQYCLLAQKDYNADWNEIVKNDLKSNKKFDFCSKCDVLFGINVGAWAERLIIGPDVIEQGDRFLIKWHCHRISGSLSQGSSNILPRQFGAMCYHLHCISPAAFSHLFQNFPKQLRVQQAISLFTQTLGWTLARPELKNHITLSPPQIFLDWADAIEEGESLGFIPGEPEM